MMKQTTNIRVALLFILSIMLCVPLPAKHVNAETEVGKVKSFAKTGSTTTTISLAWKAVSDASGYQIQIKEDDEYYTIKTIKSSDKTSYECQDLEAGTSYKFRIRAYIKSGDDKIKGEWTKLTVSTKSKKSSSKSSSGSTTTSSKSSSSGNTVYVAGSGKKYHSTKNCSSLKRSKKISEISKSDAESKGYTKCKLCY